MLSQRELVVALRSVHPFRDDARQRKRDLERARRLARAAIGVAIGLAVAATVGGVHLIAQPHYDAALGGNRSGGVGRVFVASDDGERAGGSGSSIFPERRHPYNPHYDPRASVARQRRQALVGY
jgi:hypothetical protein